VGALLHAGLINAAWTAVLALAAAIGTRLWRRHPAVGHTLWLIVLLKLVTPSLVQVALPLADVTSRDVPAPVAPFESRGPAPASLPSFDLTPGGSESVVPRVVRPAEGSHQGSVRIRWEPSRPPVARSPTPWEMTRKMAVPGVALLWLVGAVARWSVMGLNSARFRRLIRSARVAPAELRQRIGRVAERLGLRSIPEVCVLPGRIPPMVWVPLAGPPRLVLPEELWGRLDTAQQEAVLAHELAHLRRRDHWVRRLEALACGLYWWDPVAWWARREVERAEERCCDAWVLWALPTAAGAYAEALVMTAVYLSGFRQPLPLGASGVGRLSPLKERLLMILSDPTTVSFKRTAPRALLILGALSLPFLPAPASGGPPFAAAPVAAVQAPSGDQPVRAVTTPAQTNPKPNAATTLRDQQGGPPAPAPPPGTVRVTQPLVREVSDYEDFPGHIVAAREAELRARVSGTLTKVACRPGQVVKRDERLFAIDPRPYRAALDKADAELERARARQTRWQNELARVKRQVERHAIGQDEADRVEGEFLEADASVKVAVAARDVSRLNLEFTEVRAPFDGRVSGPVLGPGNVVVADTTLLATIISTDPMFVAFDVDERTVLHLNRLRHEVKIKGEPWDGPPVTVGLPDEEGFPRRGKIDSVETRIDVSTGTVRWLAVIPNPDGLLMPGLFVRVRLVTSAPHKALLVPEQALVADQGRKSLFAVTSQGIVQKRPVKIGTLYNGLRSVEGLQADEWVVIDHQNRIRKGAKVLSERVLPPAESSPRVHD
jgi:membrane fusion protein, multidrug efflux system